MLLPSTTRKKAKWIGLFLCVAMFVLHIRFTVWPYEIAPVLGPLLVPLHVVIAVVTASIWAYDIKGRARRIFKIAGSITALVWLICYLVSVSTWTCYRTKNSIFCIGKGGVQFMQGYGEAKDIELVMQPYQYFKRGWMIFRVRTWHDLLSWTMDGFTTAGGWEIRLDRRPMYVSFWFSFWLPCALFGVPVIVVLAHDRLWRSGYCRNCRYNLTGNVSGRCPECGNAIDQQSALS